MESSVEAVSFENKKKPKLRNICENYDYGKNAQQMALKIT